MHLTSVLDVFAVALLLCQLMLIASTSKEHPDLATEDNNTGLLEKPVIVEGIDFIQVTQVTRGRSVNRKQAITRRPFYNSSKGHRHTARYKPPTEEELVVRHIFTHYDSTVRPVINSSSIINVTFNLDIIRLINMDEIKQILETNVWMELSWRDEKLKWNPQLFNGIRFIRQPARKIWLPDLMLHNSAESWTNLVSAKVLALILYTGDIFIGTYVKLKSTCILDLHMYPYDEQTCLLVFGLWSYDSNQVIVTPVSDKLGVTDYQESPVWAFMDSLVVNYISKHQRFNRLLHSNVHVSIRMRRKYLYNNFFNVFAPTICLSGLTLFCFWLPSESGEKITLGISLVLTFTLFQLLVNSRTPRSSDYIPLISMYLTVTMSLAAVVIGLQVFILNLNGRYRAPAWLRNIVLKFIGRVLCSGQLVSIDNFDCSKRSYIAKAAKSYLKAHEVYLHEREQLTNVSPQVNNSSALTDSFLSRRPHLPASAILENELIQRLSSSVSKLARYEIRAVDQMAIAAEWRFIALVLDRLLFWIFFVFIVAITPTFLIIIPQSEYFSNLPIHHNHSDDHPDDPMMS